ncbi:HEAT repeat domain-containing protein [Halalkalirubrum salinum]|uniref:HEAT repeat domain-containing protein n=1 Tax=Halalkalirubrum salinum TaxID=2563889 RepID=UPI0010FB4AD4|nr:HEAT repeat domain-containing protein [Halalkalirubrum salinum]
MSLYQLARSGDTDSLTERLLGSDSPAVRKRAAELLGELVDESDTEIVGSLVAVAMSDDDEGVRAAAIDALDEIGAGAVEQLLVKVTGTKIQQGATWATAKRFAAALSSDIPELRMAAANALGNLGEASAIPALLSALDDEYSAVRIRVCKALGTLEHPRAVEPLIRQLDDSRGQVRLAAANALATIGNDRALSALLDMLSDENPEIRRISTVALGNARSVRVVEPLADTLSDNNARVRSAAVFSIIDLLSNAPAQQSHQIREAVVTELQAATTETVFDPLLDIIETSNQRRQRRNAVWFISRLVDGEVPGHILDALVDRLDDDDTPTAQFAATGLADIGGSRVEARLLSFLNTDASDEARAKAVFVLGQVGGEKSLETLRRLSEDESQLVRKRTFASISKLRGRTAQ